MLTTDGEGRQVGEVRYAPYGATRWAWGSPSTAYRYTGQRWEGGVGLYDYRARWYEPTLGRFVQPDTIVPNPANPQDLNRYSYVRNNPVRYTDPTGRYIFEEEPTDYFFIPPSRSPVGQAIRMVGDTCFGECTGAPLSDPQTTAIVQTAVGVVCEWCDWGMTLYRWSQGEFSGWDLLGFLPLLSTQSDDLLRAFDEVDQLPLPGFEDLVRQGVEPYEVGRYGELAPRSVGDKLDIHHVPQAHPARQVIPGYDPKTAPSIAVPKKEHGKIPKLRGTYTGTARDLVAKGLWDLLLSLPTS